MFFKSKSSAPFIVISIVVLIVIIGIAVATGGEDFSFQYHTEF